MQTPERLLEVVASLNPRAVWSWSICQFAIFTRVMVADRITIDDCKRLQYAEFLLLHHPSPHVRELARECMAEISKRFGDTKRLLKSEEWV